MTISQDGIEIIEDTDGEANKEKEEAAEKDEAAENSTDVDDERAEQQKQEEKLLACKGGGLHKAYKIIKKMVTQQNT